MFCPQCGAKLKDGAKFCTECGVSLKPVLDVIEEANSEESAAGDLTATETKVGAASETMLATSTEEEGKEPAIDEPPHKKAKLGVVAGVVVLALTLVVGAIFAFTKLAPEKSYPVSVQINAEGLDTSTGTKVPLRVVGTTASNKEVDETYYVGSGDSDFELAVGSYTFTVEASPIAADGTMYSTDGVSANVELSDDGAMAIDKDLILAPIAANEVTDEQINAAYEAAKNGGAENADKAEELKNTATTKRDEAAEATKPATATGNPENIFQVAEILAMNPADIPTFFEGHGATVNTPSEIQLSAHENRTCWDLNVNALKDALGSNLYLEHSYDEAMKGYENVILLGKNLTAGSMCFGTGWGSQDEELFSVSTLSSGTKPVDIFLSTNYVQKLSDDLAVQLMKVCSLSSDGYRKFEYGTEVCYASTVEIEGAHYFWFIDQRGTEENVFTSIACLSEETSKTMYSFEFPRETSWDLLNVEEKAEWVAKSFVQMINTGNGSVRTNVVTGEEEILNDDNSGYVLGHFEEGVGFVKD